MAEGGRRVLLRWSTPYELRVVEGPVLYRNVRLVQVMDNLIRVWMVHWSALVIVWLAYLLLTHKSHFASATLQIR